MAETLEGKAEAMELDFWTQTEAAGCWDVQLKRGDGTERRIRPRHIMFANGVSTTPITPELAGLNEFRGTVRHSVDCGSGLDWQGKRALVLGTGISGHGVAQDLCVSGAAEMTLIQRSPTLIVSLKEAQAPYARYDETVPFEDLDLLAFASPFPIYRRSHQRITAMNRAADRELWQGLERHGFHLTFGPDDTGRQIMYQSRGGGLMMKDDSVRQADVIVLATGYEGQAAARRILGGDVGDRMGPIWDFDEKGELQGMWRPTGQRGLWFLAGGLAWCHMFSKVLALQIKARELGITA